MQAMHGKQVRDRRIQKTEASLREALAALVHEKPYDEIVVKEILDRANVGRSTFYTHFKDKDALLLSGVQNLLGSPPSRAAGGLSNKPLENVLWFSLPLLEHIEGHRAKGEMINLEGREAIHGHLEHAIAELIEDDVRTALFHSPVASVKGMSDLVPLWIASSFVLLLNWWVENDSTLSAREADALFRKLIEPGLSGFVA